MRTHRREASIFVDVFFAVLAYVALLRWHVPHLSARMESWYDAQMVVVVALWWVLSSVVRREAPYRFTGIGGEAVETLYINALGGVLLLALDLLARQRDVSRAVMALFPVLSGVLSMGTRLAVRAVVAARRRRGLDARHALVVGPAEPSLALAHWLFRPETGLRPVGLLLPPGSPAPEAPHLPVLGDYRRLPDVLHDHVVDELAVTLPLDDPGLRGVVETAIREGKSVWVQLDRFGARLLGQRRPGQLLLLTQGPAAAGLWAKRALDAVVSAAVLLLVAPLLGAVALAIRLDDPAGPVIFRQKRVGLHGRVFTLYKFRSMVADAEARRRELLQRNEMSGPVFKVRDDPRVTRVGRLLRKYSLDELPQLWNVLRGDMSLVGPRPPLPDEVRQYEPDFRRRLSVRPGLTCLWQVSGRNAVDFHQWMELDLRYVDNWSFWLDIVILLRTIPALLFGSGV